MLNCQPTAQDSKRKQVTRWITSQKLLQLLRKERQNRRESGAAVAKIKMSLRRRKSTKRNFITHRGQLSTHTLVPRGEHRYLETLLSRTSASKKTAFLTGRQIRQFQELRLFWHPGELPLKILAILVEFRKKVRIGTTRAATTMMMCPITNRKSDLLVGCDKGQFGSRRIQTLRISTMVMVDR